MCIDVKDVALPFLCCGTWKQDHGKSQKRFVYSNWRSSSKSRNSLQHHYTFSAEKKKQHPWEREGGATKISYKGLLSCLEISIITITHCIDHVPLPHTWPDRSISSIIIVLNLRGKIIMWNGKYWYNGIKLNVKQSEKQKITTGGGST